MILYFLFPLCNISYVKKKEAKTTLAFFLINELGN